MISFLEDQTGNKLDYNRLQETVDLSKRAYDLYCQICRLREVVPAPTGVRDLGRDTAILTIGAGMSETVNYFENRYQEVKEKADRKEGIVSQERYRIAWWAGMPCFDMRVFNWVEDEYGAVVVLDINDPVTFNSVEGEGLGDTSDPLGYLARKTFKSTGRRFNLAYPNIQEDVIRSCKEHQVNASVFFTNFGCKQGNAISRIIADEIKNRLGIPTLMLDGDLLDSRVASSSQLKAKLQEYFGMLGNARG
jgi:benzoyl-CoA reductase/2-hydroxyglutaryl-CoA dehydratase subunit BcrC/BadD/HgdB